MTTGIDNSVLERIVDKKIRDICKVIVAGIDGNKKLVPRGYTNQLIALSLKSGGSVKYAENRAIELAKDLGNFIGMMLTPNRDFLAPYSLYVGGGERNYVLHTDDIDTYFDETQARSVVDKTLKTLPAQLNKERFSTGEKG